MPGAVACAREIDRALFDPHAGSARVRIIFATGVIKISLSQLNIDFGLDRCRADSQNNTRLANKTESAPGDTNT